MSTVHHLHSQENPIALVLHLMYSEPRQVKIYGRTALAQYAKRNESKKKKFEKRRSSYFSRNI